MACPAVQTGQNFLGMALYHIDCQAQAIGAYGFGALADPASAVSLALTGLLTVFIAVFGIRLLLGYSIKGRDIVGDVLRFGIVLTLATSWPAWRVIGYDVIINGPQQVASAIGLAAQLPGSGGNFLEHLQRVDEGLAAFNVYGSGRLGVAQGDWFQLGLARSAFLVGTLAPLALVKLGAGILLAITPLMAGMLLFGLSRPLFAGWARGLVMVFLASIALSLILGAELALIEPWLKDALDQRAANEQVLDAPIEIMVMTLAFALISFGAIMVMGKVAFQGSTSLSLLSNQQSNSRFRLNALSESRQSVTNIDGDSDMRARSISTAVSESVRRDDRLLGSTRNVSWAAQGHSAAPGGGPPGHSPHLAASDALGTSYRRNTRRISQSGALRDGKR